MRVRIKHLLEQEQQVVVNTTVTVKGWIKTIRNQKQFSFIEINDGSCFSNLQIIVDDSLSNYRAFIDQASTGASVQMTGLVVTSPGHQNVEVKADEVVLLGASNPDTYPLQKKRHSFEFLRTIAHLRPRTNTFGAVARMRNTLAWATHKFFQEKGFLWVHTPIITASDCEGAGEMFSVTTLDLANVPKDIAGKVAYEKDFFAKPTYLTVSGQLNIETYACGLSDVYTFGPTFRAENSNTSRHLAEFWMIEPEMAFADNKDNADCAEAYIKYVVRYVLEHAAEDVRFFNEFIDKGTEERLKQIVDEPFERATYTYAIRVLEKSGQNFTYPVSWGLDLQTEHERYLSEQFFQKPVILTDYPRDIKAFYMKDNSDGRTVAAMDVLVPKIGEIIGGSQREEHLNVLVDKIKEFKLDPDSYSWYLDLRRYGSVPHAGFGLGFERLVQFVTGLDNIRDVIPFPRYPGNALF